MKTYNLIQAAQFLGIHKETLRQRANSNQIPGSKPGKSWVFIEEDLVDYLRSLYDKNASQGVRNRRINLWHSTKEEIPSGLTSAAMEKEYSEALGLRKERKR